MPRISTELSHEAGDISENTKAMPTCEKCMRIGLSRGDGLVFVEGGSIRVGEDVKSCIEACRVAHYDNVEEFLQSKSMCSTCDYLLELLEMGSPGMVADAAAATRRGGYAKVRIVTIQRHRDDSISDTLDYPVHKILELVTPTRVSYSLPFVILKAPTSCEQKAIWSSEVDGATLETRIPAVLRWLEDCNDHLECQRPSSELPTRLIDVGRAADIWPRLVSSAELSDRRVPYATLSHCWGQASMPLKTTRQTITTYQAGIEPSLLPKTFADAIQITRKLGLHYIWIDSLCIVQDDQEDWRREAAQMSKVYAGAFLTIAASSATDSRGGCFLDQAPCHRLTARREGASDCEIVVRRSILGTQRHDRTWVLANPLNSRGWVWQEMILSRRILHCMDDQFFWQCSRLYSSEDGSLQEDGSGSGCCMTKDMVQQIIREDSFDVFWFWVVDEYLSRGLTRQSDKLPALAGIVKQFEEWSNDTCLLGLWRRNIILELQWRPSRGDGNNPTPQSVPGIPSWAWASADTTRIVFTPNYDESQNRATFVGCDIEWESDPWTSPIKEAPLVLKGPLCEMELCKDGHPNPIGFHCVGFAEMGWGRLEVAEVGMEWVSDLRHLAGTKAFGLQLREEITMTSPPVYPTRVIAETFLLLEKTGRSPNEFRRIALCSHQHNPDDVSNPLCFRGLSEETVTLV